MIIELSAPIRIESEANRRDHWAARLKRFNGQAKELWAAWLASPHRGEGLESRFDREFPLPATVTLTRIGPRRLDSDNLAGGFKRVRDTLTHLLWGGTVDDGDERIAWVYQQRKGAPREYAVHIRIEQVKG